MKKEFELKLQNEFPFMQSSNPRASYFYEFQDYPYSGDYRMTGEPVYSTYETYGCQCRNGWYELLRGLCLDITEAYEAQGKEIDLVPAQIKEKFGTLRFYYKLRDTGESPISMDFLGSGRLIMGAGKSEMGKTVHEIVSKWEEKSGEVCEVCGNPGELRKDLRWIQTLCDDCYPTAVENNLKSKKGEVLQREKALRQQAEERAASPVKHIIIEDETTAIENSAYKGCVNIEKITIPVSVEYIGSHAFENCSSLEEVSIPDGVTIINKGMFSGCASLKKVHLPASLVSIERYAFAGCTSLTEIVLPESLQYIGDRAFEGCPNLQSINIPDSVYAIGLNVFDGCHNLKIIQVGERENRFSLHVGVLIDRRKVTLLRYLGDIEDIGEFVYTVPKVLLIIGNSAFAECEQLGGIVLHEGVGIIRHNAFWGCKNLEFVDIPEGDFYSIESGAFHGCEKLKDIRFPSGVTKIGAWAFAHCKSLTGLELPEGVTVIENHTFYNCENLSKIYIPDGVTEIKFSAFEGCPNLTIYCREGTYAHKYAEEKEIAFKLLKEKEDEQNDTLRLPIT